MRYRPSFREALIVGVRTVCLVMLAQGVCMAQQPAPPSMTMPRGGGILVREKGKPCVCESWQDKSKNITRRHEELGRRAGSLSASLFRLSLFPAGSEYDVALSHFQKERAALYEYENKLVEDSQAMEAEIAEHNKRFGRGFRHVPPSLLTPPSPAARRVSPK